MRSGLGSGFYFKQGSSTQGVLLTGFSTSCSKTGFRHWVYGAERGVVCEVWVRFWVLHGS